MRLAKQAGSVKPFTRKGLRTGANQIKGAV